MAKVTVVLGNGEIVFNTDNVSHIEAPASVTQSKDGKAEDARWICFIFLSSGMQLALPFDTEEDRDGVFAQFTEGWVQSNVAIGRTAFNSNAITHIDRGNLQQEVREDGAPEGSGRMEWCVNVFMLAGNQCVLPYDDKETRDKAYSVLTAI